MSVWSIVVALLMIGVLVTIHELGHFWVARLLKIKAYEVSIFVGPKLIDWRRNDIEYSIRALPFGAYVRFNDFDENGNVIVSDDPTLLENSPRWKRLIVALAGPFMNLILGVLVFCVLFCSFSYQTLEVIDIMPGSQFAEAYLTGETPFEPGDTMVSINGHRLFTSYDYNFEDDLGISRGETAVLTMRSHVTGDLYDITLTPQIVQKPMIGIEHSPFIDERYNGWEIFTVFEEQNNGDPILKVGDFLTEVNGKSVADEDFDEFMYTLTEGDTMTLTYIRNGIEYEEECVKTMIKYANERGPVLANRSVTDLHSFAGAVRTAANMPFSIINISVRAVGRVFSGQEEVYNMVSGPIGMTTMVSEVVDDVDFSVLEKVVNVVMTAGIISIGLMFTNLLPIPGLDGMQLILIIVEMIMGHPLSKKSEGILNAIGYIMLICLVIFAFASDIIRIILE